MEFFSRLGTVSVAPTARQNAIEGETVLCAAGTVAHAQVSFPGRPSVVQLRLRVEVSSGTIYFLRSGKAPEELKAGEDRFLSVQVIWDGDIPRTRDAKGNSDCVDIFIMQANGIFVDLECGLITRGGKFYITVQRVYEGQALRTRKEGKLVTELLPARAIHAYPGSNFGGVWTTLADVVLAKSAAARASERKSRAFQPKWNPPALPPTNGGGWIPGTVRYFNAMTGTGELQDAVGKKYFVHFRAILPRQDGEPISEVPLLTPMSTVLFRLESGSQHERPKVKSVRPVLPVLVKEPTR